jgi:anaerobic selenocysteine-containing dehydrogenase
MSPADASRLGLADGDPARLETAHGGLDVTVALAEIMPGVLKLPHCAAEANANELTSSAERDPATGFPNLRALPCRVIPRRG